MELNPLAPSPFEIVFTGAALVAVLFTGYAAVRMTRGQWPVPFGLTLVLLTFLVPFGGPILLGVLRLRAAVRTRRA